LNGQPGNVHQILAFQGCKVFELYGFGDTLARGAWVTIKLSLVSVAVGLSLGILGAAAKLSRFLFLRIIVDTFTTVVRGLPELVWILFVYFGSSILLNSLLHRLGFNTYINLNSFAAGVLALGTMFGAYATDVFRIAILAVPKGQIEAGRAIGMPGFLVFRRIILPQLWRFALPGLGNLFLVILKTTSLVCVIGLYELMGNARIAVGYTKKPFTFYITVAFIYLGLTLLAMALIELLERRATRGVRKL
jgi:polar amino acid transport system permease protein